MNVDRLQELLDKKLNAVGAEFSIQVHKRLARIVPRLQKDYPIKAVFAGMGLFFFTGDDFPVIYSDDSEGMMDMSNLLDYVTDNKIWRPKNLTDGNLALLKEFVNLMNFLEDNSHLELFEYGDTNA
jgi:hypothetical protein